MANLTTTSDLIAYIMSAMGEKSDGTSPFESEALSLLNQAYREARLGGHDLNLRMKRPAVFPWALAQYPKVITLEPVITTGTVSVTQNNTAITFSSAPAASVAGWHIKTTDEDAVFRITAHTGGNTSATLDSAYTGDTDTVATYALFKIRYTLASDVVKPVTPMRVAGGRIIDIIDKAALEAEYPLYDITSRTGLGYPTRAAIVRDDGNGTIDIQFNNYASQYHRVEVDYIDTPAALDKVSVNPAMPVSHRIALAHMVLSKLLLTVDDTRAKEHAGMAADKIMAMVNEQATPYLSARYGEVRLRDIPSGEDETVVKTSDGFIIG